MEEGKIESGTDLVSVKGISYGLNYEITKSRADVSLDVQLTKYPVS